MKIRKQEAYVCTRQISPAFYDVNNDTTMTFILRKQVKGFHGNCFAFVSLK